MIKFNYILNDLALSSLITKCLYSESADYSDKQELENQIKLIQQENQQLKNNWDKLKEYLESKWEESQDIWFIKIINKMQELEKGDLIEK